MGKALYRKYRSKKLSEIVGQEHITAALDNALKSGRVSHAYLFTGPRGSGKTSIARILAHEINQLPYEDETTHLDIIEIDAASNRRIDEIRDLRDKVHISPASAKFKVYIIDEVHMLTKEAFNALLKTLEEPPAHVVFILATTEVHKLPETIVSRTQRFTFKPVGREKVVRHLATIAESEGIIIDQEALELLADHGGGSFRDSISLLDQAGNTGASVTGADVRGLLGIAPAEAIQALIDALALGSAPQVNQQLLALQGQGITAPNLAKQLSKTLRRQLIDGNPSLPVNIVTKLLEDLLKIPAATDPDALLEVVLYGAVLHDAPLPASPRSTAEAAAARQEAPPKAAAVPAPAPRTIATTQPATPATHGTPEAIPDIAPEIISETAPVSEQAAAPANEHHETSQSTPAPEAISEGTTIPTAADGSVDLMACWPHVLGTIKQTQNTLYGVLRMSQPKLTDDTLTLTTKFAFHQKRLADTKNRGVILGVFKQVSGRDVNLVCEVDGTMSGNPIMSAAPAAPSGASLGADVAPNPGIDLPVEQPADSAATPDAATDSAFSAVSSVFGGAEMLE